MTTGDRQALAAANANDPAGRRRAAMLLVALAAMLLVALAAINLAYAVTLIWFAYAAADPRTAIPDFAAFWAAGRMALDGTSALAYDWQAHRAVEVAGLGHDFGGWMPWHYPPPMQLAITPLAALPLWPAMALWGTLTLGLYLWTCWRILPDRLTLAAALAVVPTVMLLINGQAGFLIAGLIGLALIELDRRPLGAGLILGLTGVKPQLAAAVPLMLIAAGRLRAIAGGLAMLAMLAAVSWEALGGASWPAFIDSLGATAETFAGTGVAAQRWEMGASLFSGLRIVGLDLGPALALHGAAALGVLALLIRAWRSPAVAADLRAALLCYATLAVTPRVLSYDLHILLIGALFQARHVLSQGWFRGEQPLLGLAALGAFLSLLFAPGVTPVLPLALFAACWLGHVRGRKDGPERPARGASHVEKEIKAL